MEFAPMTVQQFIEKAIEGGWERKHAWPAYQFDPYLQQILLDPEAWKAVAKVEGWKQVQAEYQESDGLILYEDRWERAMKNLIASLISGKTIEQYLETL